MYVSFHLVLPAVSCLKASSIKNWWTGLGFDPEGFIEIKGYDDDYNGNAIVGDVFFVACKRVFSKAIYHAGVYCEEDVIIHYTRKTYFLF